MGVEAASPSRSRPPLPSIDNATASRRRQRRLSRSLGLRLRLRLTCATRGRAQCSGSSSLPNVACRLRAVVVLDTCARSLTRVCSLHLPPSTSLVPTCSLHLPPAPSSPPAPSCWLRCCLSRALIAHVPRPTSGTSLERSNAEPRAKRAPHDLWRPMTMTAPPMDPPYGRMGWAPDRVMDYCHRRR